MKMTRLVAMWVVGLTLAFSPVSVSAADVTGTWTVTIHYEEGDFLATYALKQEGEKVTGEYAGLGGPAAVTGSVKANDVTLTVTVRNTLARFTGKVLSATKMAGTVTLDVDSSIPTADRGAAKEWSAVKK